MRRRDFLNTLALLGSASLVPLDAFGDEIRWDEEWDVLVVGSGFAGCAAYLSSYRRRRKNAYDR